MKPTLSSSARIIYGAAPSPFGAIRLFSDGAALIALDQPNSRFKRRVLPDWIEDENLPVFKTARKELAAYFAGKLRQFTVPLALDGTKFQAQVWRALLQVPYGKTASYSDLARRIKNPQAVRAVAMANAYNPVSIIVPCHRIIGKNGALTGYSGGGVTRKAALLQIEGVQI